MYPEPVKYFHYCAERSPNAVSRKVIKKTIQQVSMRPDHNHKTKTETQLYPRAQMQAEVSTQNASAMKEGKNGKVV